MPQLPHTSLQYLRWNLVTLSYYDISASWLPCLLVMLMPGVGPLAPDTRDLMRLGSCHHPGSRLSANQRPVLGRRDQWEASGASCVRWQVCGARHQAVGAVTHVQIMLHIVCLNIALLLQSSCHDVTNWNISSLIRTLLYLLPLVWSVPETLGNVDNGTNPQVITYLLTSQC